MKPKLGIYKMAFDCGRQGALTGIFVAEIAKVNELIDREICINFGEALGKHSDISGPIEDGDITLVTSEPEAITIFEKHKLATGYNPFDYVDAD